MSSIIEFLKEGLIKWRINYNDEMLEKFIAYLGLLKEWNEKYNLTAIKDDRDIVIYHFLDSLSLLTLDIPLSNARILDIGTGAGFPGLPLKIAVPDISIVLVDSVGKKTMFLEKVISTLDIKNAIVLKSRAEDLDKSMREAYDIVLSRAVAELRILSEYCLPYAKVNGCFVAYKGPGAKAEIKDSLNAVKLLGGQEPEIKTINVPFSEKTHNLVITRKYQKTPGKYPRPAGMPKKSPL